MAKTSPATNAGEAFIKALIAKIYEDADADRRAIERVTASIESVRDGLSFIDAGRIEVFVYHPDDASVFERRIAGDVEVWIDPNVPRGTVVVGTREEARRVLAAGDIGA